MSRKPMSEEQKQKMQEGRKAAAEAKASGSPATSNIVKFKPRKATDVQAKGYIPKGTPIGAVSSILSDIVHQAAAAGKNITSCAGTLRLY